MGAGNWDLQYKRIVIAGSADHRITPENFKTRYWGIIVTARGARITGYVNDGSPASHPIHYFFVDADRTVPIMLPSGVDVVDDLVVTINEGVGSITVLHGYQ